MKKLITLLSIPLIALGLSGCKNSLGRNCNHIEFYPGDFSVEISKEGVIKTLKIAKINRWSKDNIYYFNSNLFGKFDENDFKSIRELKELSEKHNLKNLYKETKQSHLYMFN